MKRRDFIKNSTVSAVAAGAISQTLRPKGFAMDRSSTSSAQLAPKGPFWPDGARMVVSISMQMEAGAQPSSGAESPMPPIDSKYPWRKRS
jgi:capsid protein